MTYIITYDLNSPGQNYDAVNDKLESMGAHKFMRTVWLLESDQSSVTIADSIEPALDNNDKMMVLEIAEDTATYGFDDEEKLLVALLKI